MQSSQLRRDSSPASHPRSNARHLCAAAVFFASVPLFAGQSTTPAPTPPTPATQLPGASTPSTTPAPQTTPALASTPAAQNAAPATVPPPPTATAGGVDAAHYIIGTEDSLLITVWKEPTLTGNVPVRPDGMISMALLNDVPASGLTPMQLAADITTKLKKYIQDPIVSVQVNAVNSRKVFLVGEINKVGPLNLGSDMTPLQAIASAGGLTTFAHSKRIYILRGSKGHEQKIPFNYKQALKGDSHQDILLQPGDTIVIP